MKKRTKYAIICGLIGAALSYFVFQFAWVIAWLFIVGDGPTSVAQSLLAPVIVFGIVIGFWLFVVSIGYRLGIDAENAVNISESGQGNLSVISLKGTVWSAFKIIAIIMIIGVIFLLTIFWVGSIRKKSDVSASKNPATGNQRNYDIMNFMEEARIYATFCNDKKMEIVSANGGDKFCDEGISFSSINRLRQINFCGDKPEDTKWIVTNGKSLDWSIELNCKNFAVCNGKTNASCNVNGCIFSKGCDPRK